MTSAAGGIENLVQAYTSRVRPGYVYGEMDWQAIVLSLQLALGTLAVLLPLALFGARALARWSSPVENVLEGTVTDLMLLGPEAVIWIAAEGLPDAPIQMRLPTRVLERYRVATDSRVRFSLRPADIVVLEN